MIGACDSCHVSDKSTTHILSSNTCNDCHGTSAWLPLTQMDHGTVSGACDSCHEGTIATDKTATHISSSNTCDSCHSSSGWIPVAQMDHASVNRDV